MPPLVTIGIPTRNRAHYLPAALESCLAQGWPALEILVSDNGSTDGTAAYLAERKDPRLVRLPPPSRPLTVTQNSNRVLQAARGEFFMWLSDDDALSPNYIARGMDCFESRPDLAGYFGAQVTIGPDWNGTPAASGSRDAARFHQKGEFALTYLAAGDAPGTAPLTPTAYSQLMRTAFARKAGGLCSFTHYADLALGLSLWAQGGVALDPQTQFYYRTHPGNSWANYEQRALFRDVDAFWEEMETGAAPALFARNLPPMTIAAIFTALERYKLMHDVPALRSVLDDEFDLWLVLSRYPRNSPALRAYVAAHLDAILAACRRKPEHALRLCAQMLARFPQEAAPLARAAQREGW